MPVPHTQKTHFFTGGLSLAPALNPHAGQGHALQPPAAAGCDSRLAHLPSAPPLRMPGLRHAAPWPLAIAYAVSVMQRRMMPLYLKLASVSSRQCAFSASDQPSAILRHTPQRNSLQHHS